MRQTAGRITLALLLLLVASACVRAAEPARFCLTADNRNYKGFADVLASMKTIPGGPGKFMISVGDIDPPKGTRDALDKVLGTSFGWYPVVGNHEIGRVTTKTPTADATKPDATGAKDAPAAKDAKDPAATAKDDAASKPGAESKDAGSTRTASPRANMTYLRDYYDKNLKGKVNPGPKGTAETTYSFDVGDCHIAILNEYWDGKTVADSDSRGKGEVVPTLMEWLRADLKATKKTWKIVVGHEPPFPQPDRNWDTARHASNTMTKNAAKRDTLWDLLEDEGVTVFICGHTHRYSRYKPEDSKVWQVDAGQARGGSGAKYDVFIIVTADPKSLKFEVWRNLEKPGDFRIVDTLVLGPGGTVLDETQDVVRPSAAAK